MKVPVYISLGSNIDPAENLPAAVNALKGSLEVITVASTWETPPYGTSGANFYNSVLYGFTIYPLSKLKTKVLRPIESSLGRVRTEDKFAPRPIDLDVLLYNERVLEPRIWTLPFLTIPLAELIPDYTNPVTHQTLAEVAKQMIQANQAVQHPGITD